MTGDLFARARTLAIVSLFGLAGCSGGLLGLPAQGPAPDLYNLTPKSTFAEELPKVDWQLVVDEPTAARGLDNNRIALRPEPTEIKYYANARWSDRAPLMIQTLMLESFENTGKIVAVGKQTIGLRSDFDLISDLREFQAEYEPGDEIPSVRVRLNVKIVKQPRQEIVGSQNFERVVKAEGSTVKDVVLAYDEALGKVLRRVVEWVLIEAEAVKKADKAKSARPTR